MCCKHTFKQHNNIVVRYVTNADDTMRSMPTCIHTICTEHIAMAQTNKQRNACIHIRKVCVYLWSGLKRYKTFYILHLPCIYLNRINTRNKIHSRAHTSHGRMHSTAHNWIWALTISEIPIWEMNNNHKTKLMKKCSNSKFLWTKTAIASYMHERRTDGAV